MSWACKLELNLTWFDERLRWKDLRLKTNLNMISNQVTAQALMKDQVFHLSNYNTTFYCLSDASEEPICAENLGSFSHIQQHSRQ